MPNARQRVLIAVAALAILGAASFAAQVPAPSAAPAGPAAPTGLRCEYLDNPMGVDTKAPRFFWLLDHSERGQRQTAYQLLISTDPAVATGDMWDSGKVASPSSTQIVYAGKPLASGSSYFWKVKWWDAQDRESAWSDVARFDTGLFSPSDWTGQWIGGRRELRKEFRLASPVKRARAYVAGLGYHELRVNGRKSGNAVLEPGWTTYDKRVLYTVHDVGRMLRPGANAVAVMLGEGWYKDRALLLQLNVELEDGTKLSVVSDPTWKAADGPILEDSIYNGETYDARAETPGWDRPGFDDSAWSAAAPVKAPGGVLSAQMMPPIRVVDTIVPLRMTNPRPGVFVFDMGQNFSGFARLRVRGPRGADVRLRFAEMLYDDGMLNVANLRTARAEDHYILRGDGDVEEWEPRFTYHGFRYVEVSGYPGTPALDAVRGRVVHTAVAPIGSFAASKDILNKLQRIITWGQKTNLHSVPTDCDQRDERMGWMGDTQGTAEEAMMNFDMAAFYTNFVRDIRDVQDGKGQITDTVPHVWGSRPADPAWGTAYPLLCWYMYKYYGDRRVLDEQYDGLKAYVEFLRSRAENGIVRYSYYGDWVAIEKCPGALVSTFYYYYDTRILADTARILGKAGDAQAYDALAGQIRAAFHREFYDPKAGNYGDTQTANTLPLFLDMAPAGAQGGAWDRLYNDVVYGHDSHLTTGIIGTKYIMELLTRRGSPDLAYDIAVRTDYPSWGYMIENGATTLWELWQRREGSSMNSHNHPMFGSVGAWLYKALAGIEQTADGIGFERLVIAPQIVRDLTHASGSVRTVRGDVASSWSRSGDSARLDVTVPVGSEAEVVIPLFNLRNAVVTESGAPIFRDGKFVAGAAGVAGAVEKDRLVRVRVGSGRYSFAVAGN